MSKKEAFAAGDFSDDPFLIEPPAIAGLAFWGWFGNGPNDNVNDVTGVDFAAVGAGPDLFEGYAHFVSGTKAYDTGLPDVAGLQPSTYIAIGRQATTGQAIFVGTSDAASPTKGHTFGVNGPNVQAYGLGIGLTNLAPANTADWAIHAYVIGVAGTKSRIYNLTTGAKADATTNSTTYTPNTGTNLLIGSNANGAFNSSMDIVFAAGWTGVALNEAQLYSQVPALRLQALDRGFVV